MIAFYPYYKQTISFLFDHFVYSFKVSQELFSSHTVDSGTQRLLRTFLYTEITPFRKILDLGCGYGPLGIVLKKHNPEAEVHFVDRDALALEYAKQNAELNAVDTSNLFYASLGYDEVQDDNFDLIVSNIPAKVGEKVLQHFLYDAQNHLTKKGKVAIVVVDAIAESVEQMLISNENIQILYHQSWPGHQIYHYSFLSEKQKSQTSAFAAGAYERSKASFTWKKDAFQIKTTYHLPEFDQLSFDTQLLLENLSKLPKPLQNVGVINPRQGHIPVVIAKHFQVTNVVLIDRDLQSLKISEENLIEAGILKENIFLRHQIEWRTENAPFSAVVGIIPEKQTHELYEMLLEQVAEMLEENGAFLICSTSTTLHRLEEINKNNRLFESRFKEKSKGMCVNLFRKL